MKAVIYITRIPEQYHKKNMEHMFGEKLLEKGLEEEYHLNPAYEPKAFGEHGKPFLTLQPSIHYNISHSGNYVVCALAPQEVGIDIQVHKEVDYEKILNKIVPDDQKGKILEAENLQQAFFDEWVLREAYVKWTGEGFSKNLKKIPMDAGWNRLFTIEEGFSGAIWAARPMELEWRKAEVSLL